MKRSKKDNSVVASRYNAKGNHFIQTRVLKKSPKNVYKNDIIELEIKGKTEYFKRVMTPHEALIIANCLLHAVSIHSNEHKRGLLK